MPISAIVDNPELIDAIRNRKHYYIGNIGDPKFDMWNLLQLVPDHPKNKIDVNGKQRGSFMMEDLEKRGSVPDNIKSVAKDLNSVFYKNDITIHLYASFNEYAVGNIHHDQTEVIYLQAYGEVAWQCFDDDELIFEQRFIPGDMIYVPRLMDHCAVPLGDPRIGISFSAEHGRPVEEYF